MCSAGSRLLIQEPIYDKLVDKLKQRLKTFRVGDSLEKGVDMAAIVDESQRKSVAEFVEEAKKEGADVIYILHRMLFMSAFVNIQPRKNSIIDIDLRSIFVYKDMNSVKLLNNEAS